MPIQIPSFQEFEDQWYRVKTWLQSLVQVPSLFLLYRWIAWGIAGIALFVSSHNISSLPIGLFAVTGGINVLLSLTIHKYVSVVIRQTLMMIPDILFCVALLWLTNGAFLPFLPYALSSLVMPALLTGWRGGFVAAAFFIVLSQTQLGFSPETIFQSPWLVIATMITPIIFVTIWGYVSLIIDRWEEQRMMINEGNLATFLAEHSFDTPYTEPSSEPFSFIKEQHEDEPILDPPHPRPSPDKSTWRVMPGEAHMVAHQDEQNLRRVLYELTPESNVALSTALDRLVKDFSIHSGIVISMRSIGKNQPLQPVQYITLFRLAQEALINIQQHAHARSGFVILSYAIDSVRLTIGDDGVGLLDGTYERSGIHALRLMHYRFAEIDGELEVVDQQQGVTVCGTIPLP